MCSTQSGWSDDLSSVVNSWRTGSTGTPAVESEMNIAQRRISQYRLAGLSITMYSYASFASLFLLDIQSLNDPFPYVFLRRVTQSSGPLRLPAPLQLLLIQPHPTFFFLSSKPSPSPNPTKHPSQPSPPSFSLLRLLDLILDYIRPDPPIDPKNHQPEITFLITKRTPTHQAHLVDTIAL